MDSIHLHTTTTTVKNPDSVEDLTPEWFAAILNLEDEDDDDDDDINIDSKIKKYRFEITSNAGEGSGFVCNLVRVQVLRRVIREEESGSGDNYTRQCQYIEHRNIIVKLIHHEKFYRELALREKFDITEINFYQHVAPALVDQIPGLGKYLCEHVYSNVSGSGTDHTSVLVLEDMKPLGYKILGFSEEFNLNQIGAGLDFLAKFHSSCKHLERARDGQKITQIFGPELLPKMDTTGIDLAANWKTFLPSGFPRFDQFIRTYDPNPLSSVHTSSPETREQILAAHALNPDQTTALTLDAMAKIVDAGRPFATLTHFDLWRNNILVKVENDESHPAAADSPLVKIIDWQTVFYLDPAYDLVTFLFSTLPIDMLTRRIVDGLAEKYYTMYIKELDLETTSHQSEGMLQLHLKERTLEEFMLTFSTYAMAFAMIWFMSSYDTNPEIPAYHPRFWKVTQLLYLEYRTHIFMKDVLMGVSGTWRHEREW